MNQPIYYAIKANNLYVKNVYVDQVVLAREGALYVSKDHATRVMNEKVAEIKKAADGTAAWIKKHDRARTTAEIAARRLGVKLEELYKLPYGEVEAKVASVRQQIALRELQIRSNTVNAATHRVLADLRKVLDSIAVVEIKG
ncbi:hypothetical protein EBZ80_20860 [bacterium]|nr:hypothetical protein [bacterium]